MLTIATAGSFFRGIYTDDDGNLTGFEYDITEEAEKKSGYKTKYEIVGDMDVMFEGIETGKYDTMAGQVSVTEEREEKLEAVNKAIKEMHEDGTLSELSEKYFERDITQQEITE